MAREGDDAVHPGDYQQFFRHATGQLPFPFQLRLAQSERWPARIEVPTGLGKTLAVVVAWLWRRQHPTFRLSTPRRLVYCLPMRVLVEQSLAVVRDVMRRTESKARVAVLMGGVEDEGEWDTCPSDDAILLGTQDMLISRALNRGYGMSRYRWPLHFGLLNTDCLWVIDEVQLVGVGLGTTAQLQALRRKLGTVLPTQTSWMSATMEEAWLRKVDVDSDDLMGHLRLDEEDKEHSVVAARIGARKHCARARTAMGDLGPLAKEILENHRPATRTLVILNTVDRARDVFAQIAKQKPKADLVLLHSRFRPQERRTSIDRALAEPGGEGKIVVSTQVIEAGVDVSSATLFSELAPWPSLVQRFGRCNRKGEIDDARVFWLGLPASRGKLDLPYSFDDLDDAANALAGIQDVGPAALPKRPLRLEEGLVLRKKDLLDLFDTTPDLMGNDVDVSRFIRETDDHDVQVFWRAFDGSPFDQPAAGREELCAAPLQVVRDWQSKGRAMWTWDGLVGQWTLAKRLLPGLTILLRATEGGYDSKLGLDPKGKQSVSIVERPPTPAHEDLHYDGDPESEIGRWYGLAAHSGDVAAEATSLAHQLALPCSFQDPLVMAARWHDLGKAHPVWQTAAKKLGDNPPSSLVAKSASARGRIRFERPGFRHELASALAALAHGKDDLTVYLIASHHGKVRLSLRSTPKERVPNPNGIDDPTIRFARGIWEGDQLPPVNLGDGVLVPATTLMLRYMELGFDDVTGASWADRMLALRDRPDLGPFVLGFLEALIKCADERASACVSGRNAP